MPENKPFVINDRRKFTSEGELRPDTVLSAPPEEAIAKPEPAAEERRSDNVMPFGGRPAPAAAEASANHSAPDAEAAADNRGSAATSAGLSEHSTDAFPEDSADDLPPPPTAEEIAQVTRAYEATVDRLDTALRATNPGGERLPSMTFERMVQSLYMQALMQLGGAAEPGQQPRLDLIGSRQTIDMLSVLASKVKDNLSDPEEKLLESALFELRMAFLEVTQALARQTAARQAGSGSGFPGSHGFPGSPGSPKAPGHPGSSGFAGGLGGPSIVR